MSLDSKPGVTSTERSSFDVGGRSSEDRLLSGHSSKVYTPIAKDKSHNNKKWRALILLTLLAPFVYLVVTWLWAYIHTRDIEINLNLDFSVLPKTARFEESLLLTFKTGSAVIYDRTPIQVQHLLDSQSNTWQADGWNEYIPNQLFYSDAEEWIGKAYFRDALANVSSEMKTFEGFQEYHRIHELRANNQDPSHPVVAGTASSGWQLDKFKFLPLHGDAYRRFPDIKYVVSIEDDTFLFWNQLVKWLKIKDKEGRGADEVKLWGAPTYLVNGSIPFVHGGSGYVMTRGLMRSTYGLDPLEFEHNSTYAHHLRYGCCGDAELSRAFQLAIPGFKPSFEDTPRLFSGDPPSRFEFAPQDWCEPIVSLHHITTFDYVRLDRFRRTLEPLIGLDDFLRRADLWDGLMPPFLKDFVSTAGKKKPGQFWELDGGIKEAVAASWQAIAHDKGQTRWDLKTRQACQAACSNDEAEKCLLWTFDSRDKRCSHSSSLFIGSSAEDSFISGYQTARINRMRESKECSGRLGDIGKLINPS